METRECELLEDSSHFSEKSGLVRILIVGKKYSTRITCVPQTSIFIEIKKIEGCNFQDVLISTKIVVM